uniref:Uncharacterized protein n=1 Tax=Arundo donax TaxID=35708 RepID=A0A0A9FCD2_ARUDO
MGLPAGSRCGRCFLPVASDGLGRGREIYLVGTGM